MARRYKLKDLERKYGDLHKIIPRLVNQRGQQEDAARALKVSQATISDWLKDNGYQLVRRYERIGGNQ
jgi:predicted transcriptional regulator